MVTADEHQRGQEDETRPCSKFQKLSHQKESYIHRVLNLDGIKNELHSLLVNCEANLMSIIRL